MVVTGWLLNNAATAYNHDPSGFAAQFASDIAAALNLQPSQVQVQNASTSGADVLVSFTVLPDGGEKSRVVCMFPIAVKFL